MGEEPGERNDVLGRHAAETGEQTQVVDPVADARGREVGRCHQQQRFHDSGEAFEVFLVGGEAFGVAFRELRDGFECFLFVLPEEEAAAVRERGEERRVLGVHHVAVALEFELVHHLGLHKAGQVGGGGDVEPGPDFFGDRTPAHQFESARSPCHKRPEAMAPHCLSMVNQ